MLNSSPQLTLFNLPNNEDLTPIECLIISITLKTKSTYNKAKIVIMFTSGGLTLIDTRSQKEHI